MSNIFAGKTAAKGDNVEEDFIGGGGVLDTDIYSGKIKTAYISKSASSDAQSVVLLIDVNGREVRSQTWVSNRTGEVTYKDKKTGEAKNLPGFSQMNSLALLLVGKELGSLDTEELTVNIYDFEAKKELPTSVVCFTELHGEKCQLALQKQIVDKTVKNETTGSYDASGETREINEVIKFFPEDKLVTISEVTHYITGMGETLNSVIAGGNLLKAISMMDDDAGTYANTWVEKNRGQVYDKSSGKKAGGGKAFAGKSAGTGGDAAATAAKKSSLFD